MTISSLGYRPLIESRWAAPGAKHAATKILARVFVAWRTKIVTKSNYMVENDFPDASRARQAGLSATPPYCLPTGDSARKPS